MEFNRKEPMIILIAGRAHSGKTSLAKCLERESKRLGKKVVVSPYTKYLKMYIEEITGQKIDDNNKPRDLLQQISSKVIKGALGKENFFIDRQIEDIEFYSYFFDIILIPDVRFPSEIIAIKENFDNVISIGINRKDYTSKLTKEQQEDVTETSLNYYHDYDYEVVNSKNTDLSKIALEICYMIEKGAI